MVRFVGRRILGWRKAKAVCVPVTDVRHDDTIQEDLMKTLKDVTIEELAIRLEAAIIARDEALAREALWTKRAEEAEARLVETKGVYAREERMALASVLIDRKKMFQKSF